MLVTNNERIKADVDNEMFLNNMLVIHHINVM
jgi:hypothetical protein